MLLPLNVFFSFLGGGRDFDSNLSLNKIKDTSDASVKYQSGHACTRSSFNINAPCMKSEVINFIQNMYIFNELD